MKLSFRIIACAIAVSVFTSCASKKAPDNKITVWHWMNDRRDAFKELAEQYEQIAGIQVEFKLFSPPDIYAQKVIAAARAGRLPDVFGILGEKKTLAAFIKAKYVLDLTLYMDEEKKAWEKSFYPQALSVISFKKANEYAVEKGIYGVPIDITVMEFLYNKKLFLQAGLDPQSPPKDFDEFIAYAQKIKKSSAADGFVCGWGEGWLLNALATEWAFNLMGEKKFFQTIEGKVPYTDKDWVEVFSKFADMEKAGILASDITTMINKEAEDAFSRGNAAFSFNGSWSINVYKQLAPDLEYAFFPLPKISQRFPVKIWGGAGSSFMVNAKSPRKEKVINFLKWLTAKKQQEFLALKTNNLPAIKNCESGFSDILLSLLEDLNILTHPNIWPQNEDSRVLEVMNTGLQQIIMGIRTPQEVAQKIQKIKQRILRQ